MDFPKLKGETRLLIEVDLVPLQGTRFQPTGFPDLGAATYTLPDLKTQMLFVESAQSVANRLEATIWDEVAEDVVEPLRGISYVKVNQGDRMLTNSLLEAHRIASPYILGTKSQKTPFFEEFKRQFNTSSSGETNFHSRSQLLARYDINCLLHGVFLLDEKLAGGRFRLARALSGFIEAKNIAVVSSGGLKNDHIDPTGKADGKGGSEEKFGNVIYHREEYTAEEIKAYFNLDLAQIRGYRLDTEVENLLIAIALYKIRCFLEQGLRLRTACDLDYTKITVKRPTSFTLPDRKTLEKALPKLVAAATNIFANPPVTSVNYSPRVKNTTSKEQE
jgi:CRISPR-associated protein Csb1